MPCGVCYVLIIVVRGLLCVVCYLLSGVCSLLVVGYDCPSLFVVCCVLLAVRSVLFVARYVLIGVS